jgi:hypothetical protein
MGIAHVLILIGLFGAWLFMTIALGAVAWLAIAGAPGFLGAPQPVQEDGPLVWFSNLELEGGMHGRNVFSLRFRGTNRSQKEVNLKDADITSAINGARLPLEIIAVDHEGKSEIVPLDKVQLIPPGAPVVLVAKFNLPDGLEPKLFLERWRQFFFNAVDDSRKYRIPYNEGSLMPFFPGLVGPRVTKRPL